jgi:lactoylglutathione lyase
MTRLDHVNLTVTNLDESIGWYEELFGFEKVEEGLSQQGKRWAIIACNDSMIVMSEYAERESAEMNEDQFTHRIYHFGLRIEDEVAWRHKVKSRNLKLYYGGEIEYPHSRSWYVHDPSGHEIEVSWSHGKPLKFPSPTANNYSS